MTKIDASGSRTMIARAIAGRWLWWQGIPTHVVTIDERDVNPLTVVLFAVWDTEGMAYARVSIDPNLWNGSQRQRDQAVSDFEVALSWAVVAIRAKADSACADSACARRACCDR